MKSFKQYITEAPIEYELDSDQTVSQKRPILGKPIKKFAMMDSGVMKVVTPKKIGSLSTDSGDYTFHHHTFVDNDPFSKQRQHHIYIGDKEGKIVGIVKGTVKKIEKSESGKDIHHVGIDMTAIDEGHRGHGLYGHAIRAFIKKFPHVVYSDMAQTPPAKATWMNLAKNAESEGHDVRVHPFMVKTPNEGIPWNKPLDPRSWEGGNTPLGPVKPEHILFSIRRKK
jgi:hypothetical protein